MVDIEVRGQGPGRAVVHREPGAGGGVAVGTNGQASAVAGQHGFTGVAGARDSDPVREEIAAAGGVRRVVKAGGGRTDRS